MSTIEKALQKQKTKEAVNSPNADNANNAIDQAVDTGHEAQSISSNDRLANNTRPHIEIDFNHLESNGFVSKSSGRNLINEEFRSIKRKLLSNAFGALANSLEKSNVIMVSSARPGEGKTFTAVNLAISIAMEQDKTVLLVDADVLKPNVMRSLGQENLDGLMEYLLTDSQDIGDFLYNTNMDKLRIIPAGQSHHLSTELLASEKMAKLVDEFSSRYKDRVVIIDCPPLLGINETVVLANLAGQAVIVAEEGKARLADIKNAVSLLNEDMAVGFVMNKAVKSPSENNGYGYGYYYGGGK